MRPEERVAGRQPVRVDALDPGDAGEGPLVAAPLAHELQGLAGEHDDRPFGHAPECILRPLRILTLSNCPLVDTLGSGYIPLRFAQALRERGHGVELRGPESFEPWRGLGRATTLRQALGFAWAALAAVRSHPPDVVSFAGAESWLAALLLSRRRGRRFLLVSHSNGIESHASEVLQRELGSSTPDGRPRRFYQVDQTRLLERAFTQVDGIVTLSEFDRAYVLRRGFRPDGRVAAVEPCLPSEFLGQPLDPVRPTRVGFCGSWLARKGVDLLRRDLNRLLGERGGLELVLIGVGRAFDAAREFPSQVLARVRVVPFVEDREQLRLLYRSLSVLVVPSLYESFGLVTAEAMACGAAVVATRTGFAAGLGHGREALLLDAPRSPLLYEAVVRLLDDDALRRSLAAAGHARVQSLRWEAAGARLEGLYEGWLSELRGPGADG